MEIKELENVDALRLLTNALKHDFYSLYRYKKDSSNNSIKVYFFLGYYDYLIKKDELWKRAYPSERYFINPKILYSSFMSGIFLFKNYALDHENGKVREKLQKGFSLDNWVYVD